VDVLVTGGAGFIGRHLVQALAGRGDHVTVLDDLSTSDPATAATLSRLPLVSVVRGSVLDEALVGELVDGRDAVVHLASPVGVRLIVSEPLRSLQTIVHGTEHVLEAARRRRTTVLVASTSEVYGKNGGLLHEDADRVLGPTSVPRWSYASAKAIDEYLAFGYWAEHRVPTVVLRFFNTTGPGQSGVRGMVLPRFVGQALLHRDLVVYGDGSQRRCFCHVADAVRAVVGLLDEPRAVGAAFNIAAHEEVTIAVPHHVTFGNRFEDVARRRADTGRIERLLGWTAERSLDSIIADVAASARASDPALLLGEVG
jgi:UDP-glucose 4-epimerase